MIYETERFWNASGYKVVFCLARSWEFQFLFLQRNNVSRKTLRTYFDNTFFGQKHILRLQISAKMKTYEQMRTFNEIFRTKTTMRGWRLWEQQSHAIRETRLQL